MHIHFLDPYRPLASPVHSLDPRIKFVLILMYILTTALAPVGAWPVYIIMLALILAIEILSGLGIKHVHRRALMAVPFVLAALPLLFTTPGQVLIPIGSLPLTLQGVERFTSIALKSWLSVQAAIVLTATTSFPNLLLAMRAARIPRLLVALFGLMWRYLFVLADEAIRLMRARTARSGQAGPKKTKSGGSIAWRAKVTGGMAGSLFLRGIERSDRIYMAMLSRGYAGEVRSFPLPAIPPGHWAVLIIGLAFFILILVLGLLWV